jgi:tetratricopeptide (TPR) repeat protein
MPTPRQNRCRKAFALAGCALLAVGCQELTPEARQLLMEGSQAHERGDYASATTKLSQFIDQHKDAPEAAEAYYVRGLSQLRLNHRTEARRDLEAAIEKSARKDVIARAQASLAVMAYDDGNWKAAADYYAEAVPWLEGVRGYDDHMLRYAVSTERLGQWEQARQVFAQIIHAFPNSPSAKYAREHMGWNRPYFTVQCSALSTPDAAGREVARLRKLGFEASQLMETRQGHAAYLVRIGQYKTYDEATRALERIKGHVPAARVVP